MLAPRVCSANHISFDVSKLPFNCIGMPSTRFVE